MKETNIQINKQMNKQTTKYRKKEIKQFNERIKEMVYMRKNEVII